MRVQQQLATCIAFIAINFLASISAGFASSGGHYGGLFHQQSTHNLEAEVHDFSADSIKSSPSHYENLGSLGDHLEEHNFPADIEAEHYKNDVSSASADYAEAAAASEYHAEVESLGHEDLYAQSHYNEIELGGHHYGGSAESLYSELENKPVRGIDHGKGAYSYSTLYESKEDKHE